MERLADWQHPRYSHNRAEDSWLAEWVATVAGVQKYFVKSGATKVAVTPSSETDGLVVSVRQA